MQMGHMLLNATEAFLPDSEEEEEDERGRNEGRELSSASSGGGRAAQQQGQAHTSEACKKAELMCRWAAATLI
eukprot:COSAG06_NODE_245_length_19176_cov_167.625151_14_plen_73_part_00